VKTVAPKPLNVVVGGEHDRIAVLAPLGVRRFSIGASLANTAWKAVDEAVAQLRTYDSA
jgi:2-methylisocitrate lyase-like PEP mutase family enzyme